MTLPIGATFLLFLRGLQQKYRPDGASALSYGLQLPKYRLYEALSN